MSTTAQTTKPATTVVIGPVRLSYLHAFEPSAVQEGQEKKYSVSAIILKSDKKNLALIEKATAAAIELGKVKKFEGKTKGLKLPLRDGDERDDDAYEDAFFLNASSKTKPSTVDKALRPILNPADLYSGCYGYLELNFYPFNTKGNKGVAVGLNHIMKWDDGEPLAGRGTAESAFGAIAEKADEDDI